MKKTISALMLGTAMVADTAFVLGLIRDTEFDDEFATQIAFALTAIPVGAVPTGIVASTARVAPSMRFTVFALVFTTQRSEPSKTLWADPIPVVTLNDSAHVEEYQRIGAVEQRLSKLESRP